MKFREAIKDEGMMAVFKERFEKVNPSANFNRQNGIYLESTVQNAFESFVLGFLTANNVSELNIPTTHDVGINKVLKSAAEADLHSVLVLGRTKENGLFTAMSNASIECNLINAQIFIKRAIEGVDHEMPT